jgi:hypothetical protein
MADFQVIVKCFFAILLTVSGFILIGRFIFKIFARPFYYSVFEEFYWYGIAGLLFSISVYALLITGGRTILAICPVLLYLLVRSFAFTERKTESGKSNIYLFILTGCLFYFFYYLNGFFSHDATVMRYPGGDYLYYSRLAEYLNNTGIETCVPEYIFTGTTSVIPYHYGDIWTGSLVSKIFHIRPQYCFALIVYPVLGVLTALGTAGFIVKKYPLKPNYKWMVLLTIFFSGIFSIIPHFATPLEGFDDPVANFPKALWVTTFLAGTLYFVSEKQLNSLLFLCAISGLIFINILPALWIGSVGITIFFKIRDRVPARTFLPGIIVMCLTLLFYYLFYHLQVSAVSHTVLLELSNGRKNSASSLFRAIFYQAYNRKNHLLVFFPFVMLYAWNHFLLKKPAKDLVTPTALWITILLISGFLSWMILGQYSPEARQFYNNIFLPAATLTGALLSFIVFTSAQNKLIKLITFVLVIIICYRNYDFTYRRENISVKDWQAIKKYFKKEENAVLVNYIDSNVFVKYPLLNDKVYQPLSILNYYFNQPYLNKTVNTSFIADHSLPQFRETNLSIYHVSDFYQFKTQNKFVNNNDAESAFIDRVGARYLVIPRSFHVPEYLQTKVYDSLVLKNEKIYRLKETDPSQKFMH